MTLLTDGYFSNGHSLQDIAARWMRSGDAILDDISGDYALIAWDRAAQIVWLARSPLSSFPLFYHLGERQLAVSADSRQACGLSRELNLDALANWYGAHVGADIGPMFRNCEAVQPGTVVRFDQSGAQVRRFWSASRIRERPALTLEEAGVALRKALEASVADCLAGHDRPASFLSSGRDSAAVTMVASAQLAGLGDRLSSYTASPGGDQRFSNDVMLVDEAEGARTIAARAANIDHVVVTPRRFPFCKTAEQIYAVHPTPMGNPLGLYWWHGILQRAKDSGRDLILSAAMGNLTISDGGPMYLPDTLRAGPPDRWWAAMHEVVSFEGASWTNALNLSIGGMVPKPVYRALMFMAGRGEPSNVQPYLRGELKARVRERHRSEDPRPTHSSHEQGAMLLDQIDLADPVPHALFGIDVRDPTADRRVVEAWLSNPVALKLSRYDRRPIFERAFGDILPLDCIRAPRRAYQSLDWNLAYDVAELRDGISRYSGNALVREHIDLTAVIQALDRWPVDRMPTLDETADIGGGMLRAVSLAAFLHVNFPD